MLCAYTRPRYQMSVYGAIGPLIFKIHLERIKILTKNKTRAHQDKIV